MLGVPLIVVDCGAMKGQFLVGATEAVVVSAVFISLMFPVFPFCAKRHLLTTVCSKTLLKLKVILFCVENSSSNKTSFLAVAVGGGEPRVSLKQLALLVSLVVVLVK